MEAACDPSATPTITRAPSLTGSSDALTGVGVGIVIALGVTKGLSFFLFGVNPFDPITFGVVAATLLGSGLAATYLPARRATMVDPVIALRAE